MRIENLLGHEHYGYLLGKLDHPGVAWYFAETTANTFDKKLPFHSSFSHLIFKNDTGPISELFESTFPILLTALDRQGKTLKELIRIRMGLVTRTPYKVVHAPHKDGNVPHNTGLFYLTDADGETVVYNETEESKEYTVKEKLTPKANTWHQFDGAHYHSSSAPLNFEKRITLTFNYLTTDDK